MPIKKLLTWMLVAIAWFWTAYECDTIGIDVFDAILFKAATNGVFKVTVPELGSHRLIWIGNAKKEVRQ